ncbi:TetR/AcrR family transcriptional regulator [Motilibacter aurantiacus]|uniref:TetR/AcrR family transcriptional regulator n=1 Tax=Motilibacter aurantiacus TaxID=2714955 RepID=UPI00140E15DC|nr:TetR family transcriptional regulator [Motilibacter aurantiacus]NHC44208.1 TetR/AcrR family transcriptional regulator [Motilibacter aurantiacus]
MSPRGRPSGTSDARDRILGAARSEFAAKGYDKASLRGIARAAEVDPALVHHYFAGKEQVFVAAMRLPFDPALALPEVLAGPPEGLGERVARFFLGVWSEPATREPLLGLLSAATSSEAAAGMLREFVTGSLLARVADASPIADHPDRRLRVEAGAAQLLGVALLRHVVRVEPLASAPEEDVVALVAPTLQRYLSGE